MEPEQMPDRRSPKFEDGDPWSRNESTAAREGKTLDPSSAPLLGSEAHPTDYLSTRLIVSTLIDTDEALRILADAADTFHWDVAIDPDFERIEIESTPEETESRRSRYPWATGPVGLVRVRITARDDARSRPPDAWSLLQTARAIARGNPVLTGIGLDHVVTTGPRGRKPTGNGVGRRLPTGNGYAEGLADLDDVALRPVSYVGPKPPRSPDDPDGPRRGRVGVVDTGCWEHHPWFPGRVIDGTHLLPGETIGETDPATAPDLVGDVSGPLDGSLDEASGHGTFICGVLAQVAPDADIYWWRIMESDGTVAESVMLGALLRIAKLVRTPENTGGVTLDVLNLSFGYYHETPDDALLDPTFYEVLALIGRTGTVVVCSAGNDSTARPLFPAAFAPWPGSPADVPIARDPDSTPILAAGALNPNRTDSMYSNAGAWVKYHRRATNIVSAMPPFATAGGLLPVARTVTADGRTRETIDPDDFRGGYAIWSGTSFAAPHLAGDLTRFVADQLGTADPDWATARARAATAIEQLTTQ